MYWKLLWEKLSLSFWFVSQQLSWGWELTESVTGNTTNKLFLLFEDISWFYRCDFSKRAKKKTQGNVLLFCFKCHYWKLLYRNYRFSVSLHVKKYTKKRIGNGREKTPGFTISAWFYEVKKTNKPVNRNAIDRLKHCGRWPKELYCGLAFICKTTQEDFRGSLVCNSAEQIKPALSEGLAHTTVCFPLTSCISENDRPCHFYQNIFSLIL